jgi:hypothetical protein
LFLGMLLVLIHLGNLDIMELNGPAPADRMTPAFSPAAALLIFGGIVGKSAQFPLLTWLPDAMEGPTPVSALLHSATMVAAGVYLFARLFPFFSHSETAMTVFLAIGTLSMLLGFHHGHGEQSRHQAGLGLFHHQPTGLHDHGTGGRRLLRRGVPPDHPRRVQGPALSLLGGLHSPYGTNDMFDIGRPAAAASKFP